jgi:hypothetical protein
MTAFRNCVGLAAGLAVLAAPAADAQAQTFLIPYTQAGGGQLTPAGPPGLIMTGPLVGSVSTVSIGARPSLIKSST